MKARIDSHGLLEVFRRDSYKKQFCPYNVYNRCGDWCPLFIEEINVRNNVVELKCFNQDHQIEFDERNSNSSKHFGHNPNSTWIKVR